MRKFRQYSESNITNVVSISYLTTRAVLSLIGCVKGKTLGLNASMHVRVGNWIRESVSSQKRVKVAININRLSPVYFETQENQNNSPIYYHISIDLFLHEQPTLSAMQCTMAPAPPA